MKNSSITLLKVILSVPIGIGLAYPFLYTEVSGGILSELNAFGQTGSVIAIAAFLLLVLFYALDLIKTLKLVSPASRKATPNSVWLMFLLPYNFIEDFFIIISVAKSLKAEAVINPSLAPFKSFGMISGIGWCATQIVSLIPNQIGSAASLVATGFLIWHWVFIRRVNNALSKSPAS
nr:hypothetical protein [uncultured Undibacterium sp.]